MTEYRDLIPVIAKREQATMPDWADSWGIKSVRPDLRTYGGYRWPYPGRTAKCRKSEIVADNRDARPAWPGDGLCVAKSWRGMASGRIPARTLLLVAYASDEALGRDDDKGKLRLPRVYVAAVVDGERLLREEGHGADLYRANLAGANLGGANLAGADLALANLIRANLYGANLNGANLYGANLNGANLDGADLGGADVRRALMPAGWETQR